MHNTSYHGLEFWEKSVFEKLGWMVLAQEAKEKNHIKCYIENIELLLSHINDKLAYLEKMSKRGDAHIMDKMNDVMILRNNVMILHKHSKCLLKSSKKKMIK